MQKQHTSPTRDSPGFDSKLELETLCEPTKDKSPSNYMNMTQQARMVDRPNTAKGTNQSNKQIGYLLEKLNQVEAQKNMFLAAYQQQSMIAPAPKRAPPRSKHDTEDDDETLV